MNQTTRIRAVIWDTASLLRPETGLENDPLAGFIRALRPTYRTALFGYSWADLRQAFVQRWDLADAFDQVILSTGPEAELHPRIYTQAARSLAVRPREAVIVDHRPDRVALAREAGLQAVHFQNTSQVGTDLLALLNESR
jgi:FMN phosphatase YigB (HAD superfamily)